MTLIYNLIGRLVVYAVRRRFGSRLRLAGGFALVALAVGGAAAAYLLASKEPAEG